MGTHSLPTTPSTQLPLEVTAILEEARADIAVVRARRLDLQKEIEAIVSDDDAQAIPYDTFDDPSVVRAVEGVEQAALRSRRASEIPVPFPLAIGTGSRRR